ncbi:MAG: M18 family aminopeptidase [Lachnospiraceae bacterium]
MDLIERLMNFIDESPCSFWVVANVEEQLQQADYKELFEAGKWDLKPGGKYFVKRNDSSLIAFRIPEKEWSGFRMLASHSDSPCFKVKENPEMEAEKQYRKLAVEPYGGMILSTWLDRPLSIAGRVMVSEEDRLVTKLVKFDRDLCIMPNLAVHLNRELNNGYVYKKHVDMIPLWGMKENDTTLKSLLAKELHVQEEQILGSDLFLYNRMGCTLLGENREFLAGPRLDDLECAFANLEAFLAAKEQSFLPVYCLYDNEEVGSGTKQGAASTFLKDVLNRIGYGLDLSREDILRKISQSFMVSADNAHGVHPNQPGMSDSNQRCFLNRGIAIKFQAAQKYATDAYSAAVFRRAAEQVGAKTQNYANRSDQAGGSTLGNISTLQVPVATVDVGFPQLAMHSAYETAGAEDVMPYIAIATRLLGE